MKQIELIKGLVALVDDENFERINQFKWYAVHGRSTTYAMMRGSVSMHRLIMDVTDRKIIIDHRDHNGLNNQKSNLRIATSSQNAANRRSAKNSASKYLGVHWFRPTGVWYAIIKKNDTVKRLGYFKYEINAAIAYNEAAKEIHGEFANLNIIDPGLIKPEPTNKRIVSHKDSASKYFGVSWRKGLNKWIATTKAKGKIIYLGSFVSEEDAAEAYNSAQIELYGERASLNVVNKQMGQFLYGM